MVNKNLLELKNTLSKKEASELRTFIKDLRIRARIQVDRMVKRILKT